MKLATIDFVIIFIYLVITILAGFLISKRASKDMKEYFLGGQKMPWYVLGLSNASGMFDITGTMWTVAICFVYGLKHAWLPWLWPVWNQVFLMIFLAVWLRRSNVMTGAEWIKTRFGEGRGATMSHNIVVVFALVAVIGFIAYAFQGTGKFATSFMPWDLSLDWGTPNADGQPKITSVEMYSVLIMAVTALYIIKGGMYSVVLTEVLQFILMTVTSIIIGILAMQLVSPEQIDAVVPEGWKDLFFTWKLDLDWSNLIPAVNTKIQNDGFTWFGWAMMMMIFKGVLVSIAGPVPSYDMQRILATKTPKEAAKMSGIVSIVLYIPRTMMVAGFTVIALVYMSDEIKAMGDTIDFEMILPYVLSNFVPAGVLGLLLAGLIAAFMSTFAASVNSAPAYIVNDIYKKYINPNASAKTTLRMSYVSSIAIVIVGIMFGFMVDTIDSIMKWIVSGLFGGYTAANLLKWIWWRFNGNGYFWGMVSGLVASVASPLILTEMTSLNAFPIVLAISFMGCLIGTYTTPPDNEEVLKNFYKNVRPWGFWEPIYRKVVAENPDFKRNTNFKRDMFNSAIGIVWQMTLVVMPVYLVIGEYWSLAISFGVFAATSIVLKYNWLNKLED